MTKVKKWIESKIKKPKPEYEKVKREFEMAMGTPFINLRVEIPEGFEDVRTDFLNLETDQDFLREVKDLVQKRLVYKKHGVKDIP